jgi:oxygen-independent coproporphyrinogen-3 oxidase
MSALLSPEQTDPSSGALADLSESLPQAPWIETAQKVPAADLPFEFLLNALRLYEGVPASLFAERTGLSLASLSKTIDRAVARGLMSADPDRLRASALGWRHLNDLQALFLGE